jgi:hypothetical protein
MRKNIILLLILFLPGNFMNAQELKQSAGFSIGYAVPYDNSIYVDNGAYTTWPDHTGNSVVNLFYEYRFLPYFKAGVHFEYEKSKFSDFYLDESTASRYAFGFHWIGQYPQTPLHGELGGYFNTGIITQENFEHNPKGIEYGIIAGPAMELDKFTIAFHAQAGMSYFFSSQLPKAVLIFYPRFIFKIGYNF